MKNLKGVNTPEQVYHYNYMEATSVASIYYLTYDGKSYQFNPKSDDKGTLTLSKVSETEYFYDMK